MENWAQISQLLRELSLAAAAAFIVYAIVFKEWVYTRGRALEWKERALKAEARAEKAEEGLRANTAELERTTRRIEESNQRLIDGVIRLYGQPERR